MEIIPEKDRQRTAFGALVWPVILGVTMYFFGEIHVSRHWWDWSLLIPLVLSFGVISSRLQFWSLAGKPRMRDGNLKFEGDPVYVARALAYYHMLRGTRP